MRFTQILVALLLPLAFACGSDTATVRLVAGDASGQALQQALDSRRADDFDSIQLNVVSLRVRMSGGSDGGWTELLRDEDRPFVLDLHRLLAGELIELAEGEIPAGTLTEIRFVLDAKDPGYAIPAGGTPEDRIAVRVPSGTTSGLKLKGPAISIEEGGTHELVVDFDVQASIKDDKDGLRIRPVIRLRGVETEAVVD